MLLYFSIFFGRYFLRSNFPIFILLPLRFHSTNHFLAQLLVPVNKVVGVSSSRLK